MPGDFDIQKGIDDLKQNRGGVDDFFISSPYDSASNLDGSLTKEIFKATLLVDDGFKRPSTVLHNAINSFQKGKKIVLLSGFSGGGKTTFIHHYASSRDNYFHVFIDFEEISKKLNEDGLENKRKFTSSSEHLLELLKLFLVNSGLLNKNIFSYTINTFLFIINNRTHLKRTGLISNKYFNQIKNIKSEAEVSDERIIEVISNLNYQDVFTFFFTLLFNTYYEKEKVIIYFDNLDKVELEYLTDRFIENFEFALSKANTLSQSKIFKDKKVRFNQRFRFVFCLRDANGILLNQHIADRIKTKIKVIPVSLTFNPEHFDQITNKRIELMNKVYEKRELGEEEYSGKQFEKNLKLMLDDEYYKKAFIPLFNNDYRKSILVLLEAVRQISKEDNHFYKNERLEYGARGYLLHALIKNFFKDNFISDYPFIEGKVEGINTGYCFIDRMVITVLCYNTRFSVKFAGAENSRSCKFYSDLIKDLEVLYNYDYNLIIGSICRLFTYHEEGKNWVHLISIMNKRVRKIEDFIDEITILNQIKLLRETNQTVRVQTKIRKLVARLDNIKVKLNPSGFAYVKYILPHFEFYSTLCHNEDALYQKFYVKEQLTTFKYEKIIKKVFSLVKDHQRKMKSFYENHMNKIISKSNFYRSKYCFQLLGEATHNVSGYFHITRIITSQIDYLDRFRRKMITLNKDNVLFDKYEFNKKMTTYIEQYVELLKESQDLKAKKNLVPHFSHAIDRIKKSEYSDPNILIRLPREHKLRE